MLKFASTTSKSAQCATSVSLALAVVPVLVSIARADTWLLPERTTVLSTNELYRLEIIPNQPENQLNFWKNKIEQTDNACILEEFSNDSARGVFAVRRRDGQYERRSEFRLLNEFAPVSALVSDDGRYVVTFDNWHMSGYGNNVVVIYRTDGTVVNSLALRDFLTDEDIYELPRSASSIHWAGAHYLDHSKDLLILRVEGCGRTVFSCDEYFDVPVSLETGISVMPTTNHLPQPRVFFSADPSTVIGHADEKNGQLFCKSGQYFFAHSEVSAISTSELLEMIVYAPLPTYPQSARALNVQGSLVLELKILNSGEVGCVRILRYLPFGIVDDLQAVALDWRFKSDQQNERPFPLVGRLTVEYRWVAKNHPAYSNTQPPIEFSKGDHVFIN